MIKAKIIFAPQFEPFQPYLSLPYLKSLLKIYGIRSNCYDANVDFYWWLFRNKKHLLQNSNAVSQTYYLYTNIDKALQIVLKGDKKLYNYRWAMSLMDEYLIAVSPPEVRITLSAMGIKNKYSSSDLKTYIYYKYNIFNEYFEFAKENILEDGDTQYYLFSLVVLDQLGAALSIAKEIKEYRPNSVIVFGGAMVSRFYKRLVKIEWLKEIVDVIIPGEAYKIIPDIFGLDKVYSGHVSPDFSDLDLTRYFSPTKVLPYLVSHGCKWGLCTFCSHHLSYEGYRTSQIEDVINDLIKLRKQYNIEYISFCDEYLTYQQIDELTKWLIDKHIDIKWSTFVRAEHKFAEKEFTKKIYEGGARVLFFGFETVSQRLLKLMQKGNNSKLYEPILESCKNANIAVRIDLIVGFPTETHEETEETFNFIKDNQQLFDTPFSSYPVAVFELRENIPIFNDLPQYNIKVKTLFRGDLDEQYDFRYENGRDDNNKILWREKLINFFKTEMNAELIVPNNKTHQLILKDWYDNDKIKLSETDYKLSNLHLYIAKWNSSVIVEKRKNKILIQNNATGGLLEVRSILNPLVEKLNNQFDLQQAYAAVSSHLSYSGFYKLINYLYRNDYIQIQRFRNINRRIVKLSKVKRKLYQYS